MTAFQKAEALATQRYDRDKLLALVDAMRSTSFEVLGSTVVSLISIVSASRPTGV